MFSPPAYTREVQEYVIKHVQSDSSWALVKHGHTEWITTAITILVKHGHTEWITTAITILVKHGHTEWISTSITILVKIAWEWPKVEGNDTSTHSIFYPPSIPFW